MVYIIGLTGGIGSGKSTAANLFEKKGIELIDADIVARELVAPNTEGLKALADYFGAQTLNQDGSLNRAFLRQRIFSNPSDKIWLEQFLHPKIKTQMIAQSQKTQSPYCLWVAPLLIENKLNLFCQRVLIVDAEESIQISRTCKRDRSDPKLVKKILLSQLSRADRLAYADDIIHNNANIDALTYQVDCLHEQYLLLSAQKST